MPRDSQDLKAVAHPFILAVISLYRSQLWHAFDFNQTMVSFRCQQKELHKQHVLVSSLRLNVLFHLCFDSLSSSKLTPL